MDVTNGRKVWMRVVAGRAEQHRRFLTTLEVRETHRTNTILDKKSNATSTDCATSITHHPAALRRGGMGSDGEVVWLENLPTFISDQQETLMQ